MSLQVWLPLNGDLRNQGCNNPSISLTSGNTWASSGKIGNSSLTLTKLQTILPTSSCMTGAKEVSYCYWVKVNTAWSTNWLDGIRWIETDGSTTATARQEFYTNCTLVGTWYKGGSIAGKAFTPGVWTHLAATFNYNTGEANFYIDGILKGTTTNVDKTYYCRGDFYIGDNGVDICQNDVRIYDRALSAAEVKEISQGLVLHYKLNQPIGLTDAILNQDTYTVYNNYAGSGTTGTLTNLSETFNGHVVRREVMTPNDTSVNNFKASLGSHGVYGHRQTFLANTKYVFWIYYRPISHTDIRAGGTASNIGGWTEISPVAVGDGWYRVGQYRNGTVTTDKTDNIFTSFYTPTAASGVPITIDWAAPHLLVGTTEIPDDDSFMGNDYIEDSSGYNHNGTILNSVSISSDTPRYSTSTNLSATNSMINCGRGGMVTDSITVNFWLKSSSWGNPVSCTEGGGWNFEGDGDYFRFPIYISGVGYKYGKSTHTRAQICNNQWHMLTGIYDRINQKVQIYVDGQLDNDYAAGTSNNIGYNGSNVIWIGAEATGSNTAASNGMAGLFSDFRIYCTALSAADVLELYHTGAKVDNKGGIHAYELNEGFGIEENAKFVNNSATSMTYDAATDTYTIVSPVGTSSWGYGIRLADTPALEVPYGMTYRWTAEVWTPVTLTVNTDYNNAATSAWAGNDNDATSTRLPAGNTIPANTWTRIYRGASNTHTSNTNHLPIRDYSSLGLVTNGQSGPVTWKVRHLQWYLVDTTFKPQIKKTGIIEAEHFTEVEQNLNKPAQFNKQMFSVNGNEFLEL